jgi:hypothetical protein
MTEARTKLDKALGDLKASQPGANGLDFLDEEETKALWLSEKQAQAIKWIWRGRLAAGEAAEIIGEPGMGKGLIEADALARLTRGWNWPDGSPGLGKPVNVLVLTDEEDLGTVLRPRLDVAGGDPERVRVLTLDTITEMQDLELIASEARAHQASVITVDPLNAYLPENVKTYSDHHVRRAMRPLARVCRHFGLASLFIRHVNKDGSQKAIHRGGGSGAFTAAARISMVVGHDPEDPDRYVLSSSKVNNARKPLSLAYRIGGVVHDAIGDEVGRIEWLGACDITADQALGRPDHVRTTTKQCEAAIAAILDDQAVDKDRVMEAVKNITGASESTIQRAAANLRVLSHRTGFGKTALWALPGFTGWADQ